MSHKPEVFVPAKEAAKHPETSFPISHALCLSIAENCSMFRTEKVIEIYLLIFQMVTERLKEKNQIMI